MTSNVGGISEIVRHNIDGYVFDILSEDQNQSYPSGCAHESAVRHLLDLCKCKQLRDSMGNSAAARYQELFTLSTMVKHYRALLFDVIPPRYD